MSSLISSTIWRIAAYFSSGEGAVPGTVLEMDKAESLWIFWYWRYKGIGIQVQEICMAFQQ